MSWLWSSLVVRRRVIAIGVAGLFLAVALIPRHGVNAAKRPNGIVFEIKTSQGIKGTITYLKRYEGEGKNFAQLEVEVLQRCTGTSGGSYTERANVILQGRTRGNRFIARFRPQQSSGDKFLQRTRVRFRPKGRSGGLPRWRKATGTVHSSRSIDDPFVKVDCASGPVTFKTLSSRREHFGPRPDIIVHV